MRIHGPGWKKFGSGINIQDPQHCTNVQKIVVTDFLLQIEFSIVIQIYKPLNIKDPSNSFGFRRNSLYRTSQPLSGKKVSRKC
jgi:hypothetical protein